MFINITSQLRYQPKRLIFTLADRHSLIYLFTSLVLMTVVSFSCAAARL